MLVSVEELTVTCVLFGWIIFAVGFLTKKLYEAMEAKGFKHNVAVYYNRKLIHMSTGGLVALVTPFVFKTPLLPLVFASLLAVLTYIPHKTGKLMYWFQTEENMYEVSFCIMWGATVTFGWLVSGGNFWFGVLPVLFMSFGDGIT
ncbi:dolichol kinase, partial [Candidatus Bathyarchaeota archaeon]